MESYFDGRSDPAAARDALDAIGNDRTRIGERMTAETWWAAPAQGIGAALFVAAPGAGWQWAWVLVVASMGVFIGVEMLFRKRSGLNIARPAGPRGLALLILLIAVLIGGFGVSVALAILDLSGWIALVAIVTLVAHVPGIIAYDRTYAAEVRRAR